MATFWIEEFEQLSSDGQGRIIPVPYGTPVNQKKTLSGSSQQSNAFASATRYVRIHADAACHISFGTNPTATTSTEHVAANAYIDRAVPVGESWKVAVIQA